ncbi:flippase [Haloferacaceae archaeon DSL9]
MKLGQTSAIHFASNTLAAALSFVAVIYFARILGADTLGYYYLVIALLAWLKMGGNLGVGSAITKRVSEGRERDEYVAAGGLLIASLFVLISGCLLLFRGYVDWYLGVEVTEYLIVLLFATLCYSFFTSVLDGNHLVHVTGMLAPVRIVTRSLVQIGAVFAGFGLVGLLVGYAVGWLLAALFALVVVVPALTRPKRRHVVSLVEYAKYSWLGNFQSKTFNWIDVLVLGFFVPSGLVGIYSVAWSIAIFLVTFSQSLSSTIFPEISRLAQDGEESSVAELVTRAVSYAGIILVPGFVGGSLLSGRILRIYGPEFVEGGVVMSILIGAVLLYGYQKQLSTALNGIDRPDLSFRVNGAFAVANVVLNIVLIYRYGWIGAAVATMSSAALGVSIAYFYVSRLLDVSAPLLEIGRQWLAAAIMGGVIYGGLWIEETYRILGHNTALVLLLVGSGAGVYFAAYFAISDQFRVTVLNNLPFDLPAPIR